MTLSGTNGAYYSRLHSPKRICTGVAVRKNRTIAIFGAKLTLKNPGDKFRIGKHPVGASQAKRSSGAKPEGVKQALSKIVARPATFFLCLIRKICHI